VPPPDQAAPDLPGLTDISWLGSGGFADVYAARHKVLRRRVAAKVFKVALLDTPSIDQFNAECQALNRLSEEPGVLKVWDAGQLPDGRPYLYSELCDGSLQRLMAQRGGSLPPGDVIEFGRQIATALVAAHFAQVLHGDVSPQNILLRSSGAPVLADFGLAVMRDYRGNVAAGFNPAHAAPETIRHDGTFTVKTDVYGLGSTLYTALTGHPPFPSRPGEKDVERSRRILTEPAPRLDRADIPSWLADLVSSMLAKTPENRPEMADVVERLERGDERQAASLGPAPAPPTAPPNTPPRYIPPTHAPPPATERPGPAGPTPPAIPAYRAPAEAAPVTDSQVHTRNRAAAAPAPDAGAESGADQTRLRADRSQPEPVESAPLPWWRRRAVQVAAGLAAVAVFGVGAAIAFNTTADEPQPPAAQTPMDNAAPGAQTTKIELATPELTGDSVTLHWSAPQTLDYAVIVAADGAPPTVELVRRATTYAVPIQPGSRYCFQIQGSDGHGGVFESNVQALGGAVCRFEN
jgi:serine/threonine protein kinase